MRERLGTRVLCGGEENERSGKWKWSPEIGDHRRLGQRGGGVGDVAIFEARPIGTTLVTTTIENTLTLKYLLLFAYGM